MSVSLTLASTQISLGLWNIMMRWPAAACSPLRMKVMTTRPSEGDHSFAQAPVGPGSIKLGKVQPAVVKTPEFNLTSGPTKRSKPADWLEIEVEYETKPDDIDELTFKFTVMFEKKLLDGEVTYANISKGREHRTWQNAPKNGYKQTINSFANS